MANDKLSIIQGVYSLALTTFKPDGSVDYNEFEKLVDFLGKTGAQAIGLWGIVAEFHKVNDFERNALSAIFLDTLRSSKSNTFLSVTDWSTEVAVKRAQQYEQMGADAVMLLPPFYFNPDINEVRNHMISVLEAVDIPVIIQYAPQATGHYMPEEELVAMANKYPNAAYKLEFKPAVEPMQKFLDLKPDIAIITGYAGLEMPELYKIGVKGVMPACSYTEVYVAMHNMFLAGDMDGVQKLYDRMEKYLKIFMETPECLLAIEKEILVRRGVIANGTCRRPRYHLKEENFKQIDAFLNEFKDYLK